MGVFLEGGGGSCCLVFAVGGALCLGAMSEVKNLLLAAQRRGVFPALVVYTRTCAEQLTFLVCFRPFTGYRFLSFGSQARRWLWFCSGSRR